MTRLEVTLWMIRSMLRDESCRAMPMADRLALELVHHRGRVVFEIVGEEVSPRPAPRDPDGIVVSRFAEAQEWLGLKGICEVPGVCPEYGAVRGRT